MNINCALHGQGFAHPKNSLPYRSDEGYSLIAPAKSGAGIGVLNDCMATHDAPSVFFCAVNPSHLFSRVVVKNRSASKIMVGWVGAEKSAPESIQSGYANPAQSTTSEIGVSGGGDFDHCMEAATWLLPQPRIYPNSPGFSSVRRKARAALPLLSGSSLTVNRKPARSIPAGILSLPLKFALNARFTSTAAARLSWMWQKWEAAMFNLQTLTARARELRGNVVKAATTKGTRTMTPVYERDEQRKLRERIQQTQPDWILLWWDIATVTGWRTSDVCNFRYSCINWETGTATIIVAKQTKAAEARATRKGIDIVRQQRKDAARLAGDHIAYMNWDSVSCDELAAGMTGQEQAIVFELVAKAEVKHDTKQLPPGIIKRLRERMERNLIGDDLVFSRSQIESNRCQSLEGSVTRQTIWKKLHGVMAWFTRVINTRLRLSAYSSRKIAAFNLMSAGGEQGLLVASEMLGHSNPAITRTYLQLGSKAADIQTRLAMEVMS